MSPSRASFSTKPASFFSSSLWKRVFSRHRISPLFIAATAASAASPMQSSAKPTLRFRTWAAEAATGLSDSFGSRPFGRPKCASRITLPPLSAISLMVGATRSIRVMSVTRPFSIGTLRSTRTSARLPERSAESRVRKFAVTASAPQISFPIATAVSAMRLEKPHSLSYQAITRTSVPFITLV
jgi:hypothetical protein